MGKQSRVKRERRKDPDPPWTPFTLVNPERKVADEEFAVWQNSRYVVLKRRLPAPGKGWPAMLHLSIRRQDRAPIHDWRELQRIKNELVGPENEGVELYPAESRLVDSSNQFHLYVIEDPKLSFPIGYRERVVSEAEYDGSKQRPFESPPPDLISQEEMEKIQEERKRSLLREGYGPVKGPN